MRKLMMVAVAVAFILFSGVYFPGGQPSPLAPPKPPEVTAVGGTTAPRVESVPAPAPSPVMKAPAPRPVTRRIARKPVVRKPVPAAVAHVVLTDAHLPATLSCVCVDEQTGKRVRLELTNPPKKKGFWGKVGGGLKKVGHGVAKPFKAVGHLFHSKKDK